MSFTGVNVVGYPDFHMNETKIINATRKWVEDVVVGYNLCPFARRELVKNRVRFVVSPAETGDELLAELQRELDHLTDEPEVETTLLIHPRVLDRKSTRLNSSHVRISYAVFC